MIVLTQEQAINVLGRSRPGAALIGRRLPDGRFAYPDAISGHPDHAVVQSIIAAGSSESPDPTTMVTDSGGFRFAVNGKDMRLANSGATYSLNKPSADVWRFEIHGNDYGDPINDPKNGNRRSEVITDLAKTSYGAVQVWVAWSTVLGSQHAGIDGASYIVHQWHSDDTGSSSRSPILTVNYGNGTLDIITRSDAELSAQGNGVTKTRYSTTMPTAGEQTNFVLRAVLGQVGHLQAWINGNQVYDADIPIGYYNDLPGKNLGYPHWGIYGPNRNKTDVLFHANPEFGTADLSARIANPLPVTTPAAGWV